MDYMKIYNDLVQKARSQVLLDGIYVERHHIQMKSLGGSDDKSNIVAFTPRQHYIAHLLLFKAAKQDMLAGKDKTPYYKALRALSAMIQLPATLDENGAAKRIFKFGSSLYDSWKKELAIYLSASSKAIAEQRKQNKDEYDAFCKSVSDGLKAYIQENGPIWQGKKHTDTSKQKMKATRQRFHPGAGEKNSQYGTIAIYNETTFERATQPKDQPIPEGWVKGRFYKATTEELIQRKKILDEILRLDPASKATIRMKLDHLQKILDKILNPVKYMSKEEAAQNSELKRLQKKQALEQKITLLCEMYKYYDQYGFKALVEKYDYKYTLSNFVQYCKAYVPEFVSQNGKKRGKYV